MAKDYRIDYTREIEYILKHFQELSLTDKELKTLQETLSFVKWQVEEQIVQEIVRRDSDLLSQIDKAQEGLRARVEELSEQDTIEKEQTEQVIQEIESIKQLIGKPEDVISYFLKQWIETSRQDLSHEARFNNLINICATNMAKGYMSMERTRTGKEGSELFYHDKTKGTFEGYIPNPEAIEEFLKLIRDPATIEGLIRHGKAFKSVQDLSDKLQEVKDAVNRAELLNRALTKKEKLCQDVEEYFKQVAELTGKKSEIAEEIRQISLPQKTNAFMRLINTIIGRTRKQENKAKDMNSQMLMLTSEIDDLILHKNDERAKNSLDYGLVHSAYLEAGESNLYTKDKGTVEIETEVATRLVGHSDMRSFVIDTIDPSKRLEDAKKQEERASETLDEKLKILQEAYKGLSLDGKKMVDESSKGYVDVEDIKSRYIIFDLKNGERRYGVSPFVSTLILETLMKLNNIKTIEDAQKFGLTVSQADLANYEEKARKIIRVIRKNLGAISEIPKDEER